MLTNKIKYKYDLSRDTRGFLISSINDHIVRFAAKVLDTKLVQKMWLSQSTIGAITAAKIYAVGTQMNWSQYILNELLAYVEETQDKGNTFHYSWLLIFILFVSWE